MTENTSHRSDMYDTALRALIYTFPLVEMVRMRAAVSPRRNSSGQFAGDSPDRPLRWANVVTHARKLLGAGDSRVVLPNNDTLYSNVWFDLSGGPQVLHVPDTNDRYYVLGLLDMFTNPFASLGRRTTGTQERLFLIAGPDWVGAVPDDMLLVRCPTNWVWMIGRIVVDGMDDVPAVNALQDQVWVRPLDGSLQPADGDGTLFDAWIDHREPVDNAATHIRLANRALRQTPPPARDREMMTDFSVVGIGPDQPDDFNQMPADVRACVERAYTRMRQIIAEPLGDETATRWRNPFVLGLDFGQDWQTRAAVAYKYIGALSSDDAIYPTTQRDSGGAPLNGRHRYRLRFAAGQLPPVDCFWSVSMYDTRDFKFVHNAIGRYAIGDRTEGLHYDADGGLTICLQHAPPAPDQNWLPAPAGDFLLCLRAYQPRPSMRDGSYRIPPIERAGH